MRTLKHLPKLGDHGNGQTAILQQALKDKGYDPGKVDDWYGNNTQKAFEAFLLHELGIDIEPVSVGEDEPGPILGIDMSHHQNDGDPDRHLPFEALFKKGNRFAFFKCTEHTTYKDPYFERNYEEAKAAGFVVGAYHFFRGNRDAGVQAAHFLKHVKFEPGVDLPPVLDLETLDGASDPTIKKRAMEFLLKVESALGVTPIIYASPGFLEGLGDLKAFKRFPLWVAHYTKKKSPRIPKPWTNYLFWQFTESPYDSDWFNGSLIELRAVPSDFEKSA